MRLEVVTPWMKACCSWKEMDAAHFQNQKAGGFFVEGNKMKISRILAMSYFQGGVGKKFKRYQFIFKVVIWRFGLVALLWLKEKENGLSQWSSPVRVLANITIHFSASFFMKQRCGDFLLQTLLDSRHLNKWMIHGTWFKGEKMGVKKFCLRQKKNSMEEGHFE